MSSWLADAALLTHTVSRRTHEGHGPCSDSHPSHCTHVGEASSLRWTPHRSRSKLMYHGSRAAQGWASWFINCGSLPWILSLVFLQTEPNEDSGSLLSFRRVRHLTRLLRRWAGEEPPCADGSWRAGVRLSEHPHTHLSGHLRVQPQIANKLEMSHHYTAPRLEKKEKRAVPGANWLGRGSPLAG